MLLILDYKCVVFNYFYSILYLFSNPREQELLLHIVVSSSGIQWSLDFRCTNSPDKSKTGTARLLKVKKKPAGLSLIHLLNDCSNDNLPFG